MVAVLAVILCIFLPFTTSFAQIDNSLVLYLPFDEGTGDIAKDGSGNGNDGVLNGKPKWVEGKYGSALEFDGKTNYVEVPFSDTLNITENLTRAAGKAHSIQVEVKVKV